MIQKITLVEVKYLAYELAKKHLAFDEPIPDFSSRFPNALESCLATPFQSFSKKSLYTTLAAKTAALFYLMVKNHPFQNGNKRIAVTTLLVFLDKNGKWIKMSAQELYNLTLWIAQSPAGVKNEVVQAIESLLKKNLINS